MQISGILHCWSNCQVIVRNRLWLIFIHVLQSILWYSFVDFLHESSQVVGWPPIRAYRINSLVNQAKSQRAEEEKELDEKDSEDPSKKKIYTKTDNAAKEKGQLGFVKVNMDGVPIGRKVDLNAHSCYDTLAQMLEDMFFRSTTTVNSRG